MKFTKTVLLVTALFSFNAFADNLALPQASTGPVIHYVPDGTVIPMLNIKFDCGDCKADNKIKALVEGAYLDQLEAEKAKVDEDNLVVYTITKYRTRGGARYFLGALAGADNITGTIECRSIKQEISDTAISAVNGIEAVARNVGKDAYQAMRECVLGANSETQNAVEPNASTGNTNPAKAQ